MKMPVRCEGPRWLEKDFNHKLKMVVKSAFGRTRHGEEGGPKWRGFGVVQKVFGLCAVSSVIEAVESLQTTEQGHKKHWKMLKNSPQTRRRRTAAEGWIVEEGNSQSQGKSAPGCQREGFEVGGRQKKVVGKENVRRQRSIAKMVGKHNQRIQCHTRGTFSQ